MMINKSCLSTRKVASNYKRTVGQGLNALFGFCRSWTLTTLGTTLPLPKPQTLASCRQHPLAAESKIGHKVLLAQLCVYTYFSLLLALIKKWEKKYHCIDCPHFLQLAGNKVDFAGNEILHFPQIHFIVC